MLNTKLLAKGDAQRQTSRKRWCSVRLFLQKVTLNDTFLSPNVLKLNCSKPGMQDVPQRCPDTASTQWLGAKMFSDLQNELVLNSSMSQFNIVSKNKWWNLMIWEKWNLFKWSNWYYIFSTLVKKKKLMLGHIQIGSINQILNFLINTNLIKTIQHDKHPTY